KAASPVIDYSDELRSKGMSGLFVRDKKQKGMSGVKKDHGGLSNALKDSKSMQGRMAKGFIPNFAKDEDPLSDSAGRDSTRMLMVGMLAPIAGNIVGEVMPSLKNLTTSVGEAASTYATVAALTDKKWIRNIAALGSVLMGARSMIKKMQDKSEEFAQAAGLAGERLTNFSNGTQSYLQNFEAFNSAIIDSSKSAEEINRLQSKMADSLSQIDPRYRAQIASATTIEEAQKAQSVALRKLTAETQQVSFASEMQKMFNDNRDVMSATEILGSPGTLAKIGEGLKKSFTTDALKRVENIDSILTGSQEEIINKLQGAFKIDPRLAESLSDFKFSEFIEVMEQLKQDVRDIKDTQQLMEKISELRKEENERLKEFRDAAKEAGDQYVDFTNKLRATGEALSSTLSNS
ncbi:MAG TPA: hypothetical protein DEG69_16650, partial [Flavobacteriaceae bacterium]|nr:hypothetical protein [Flavobacteriaceae bacterium]